MTLSSGLSNVLEIRFLIANCSELSLAFDVADSRNPIITIAKVKDLTKDSVFLMVKFMLQGFIQKDILEALN
ncbi:hypothetical protein ZMTM_07560 [Methyloradius palustris]|uniref:Uncharacterized protein n=1 Tax=Methyloradius palustris TaxID=2778876 RepID=A0A8D5FYP2_9PROT|nr:hypothetical protein ZMTM_07560 [Methyloradius palustris]